MHPMKRKGMSKLTKFAKPSSAAFVAIAVGWVGYEVFRPAYDGNAGIASGNPYAPTRDTHSIGYHHRSRDHQHDHN